MKVVNITIFEDPITVLYYIGDKWGFGDRFKLTDLDELTFKNDEDLTFLMLKFKMKKLYD